MLSPAGLSSVHTAGKSALSLPEVGVGAGGLEARAGRAGFPARVPGTGRMSPSAERTGKQPPPPVSPVLGLSQQSPQPPAAEPSQQHSHQNISETTAGRERLRNWLQPQAAASASEVAEELRALYEPGRFLGKKTHPLVHKKK